METFYHCTLQPYNTLGVDAVAEELAVVDSVQKMVQLVRTRGSDIQLVVGGGSNIVITKNISGLVVVNRISGIEVQAIKNDHVSLNVGAGVVWDELVQYSVANHWWGIENLAAIPGSVGAGPIQNIGAYGVELNSVLQSIEAIDRETGRIVTLQAEDCGFGYRDSRFKTQWKDQFIILRVTLALSTRACPTLTYGELKECLQTGGVEQVTPRMIYDRVSVIRANKLPDPQQLPNVGSFFKNPIVSPKQWDQLRQSHGDMPHYLNQNGCIKLAAGWLIEQLGWKSRPGNGVAVHTKQALVLINTHQANGQQILDFAHAIQSDVQAEFGIQLEIEPTIV